MASCCWPKHSQANWIENERATRRARGVNNPPAAGRHLPILGAMGHEYGFCHLGSSVTSSLAIGPWQARVNGPRVSAQKLEDWAFVEAAPGTTRQQRTKSYRHGHWHPLLGHGWFRHKYMMWFWPIGCKRRLLGEDTRSETPLSSCGFCCVRISAGVATGRQSRATILENRSPR